MALNKNTIKHKPVTDQEVEHEIGKLSRLEKEAFGVNHGRFDFYHYLKAVHKLHCKWKKNQPKTRKKQIERLFKLTVRRDRLLIHAIVDASSRKDSTTKNRWVRALISAHKHRASVREIGLAEFVHSHGGLQKCAGA